MRFCDQGGLWMVFLLAGSLIVPVRSAEIWVSPTGDDGNPGTRERPVASLAHAQRQAREIRRMAVTLPEGGIRIILRGGVYPLSSPLLFRPEDSGTASSPTVVEAASGEHPVLSGGVVVSNWRQLSEEIAGLPAAARGHVWVADAPCADGRVLECRQLWVGDRKAVRARTPDTGVMDRLVAWDRTGERAAIPAALVASIQQSTRIEMVIQQQWEIAILRVRAVNIEGNTAWVTFQQPESRLEFEHPWPQPILPPQGGGAFFLVGAATFLDQPGEWCQEGPGGRILYWPRTGEDLNRERVIVPALETLVEITGTLDQPVTNLQFRGIGFEHTAWRRPAESGHVPLQVGMPLLDAYKLSVPGTPDKATLENQAWIRRLPAGISVSGARHVRFERCRFEHMAASGVDFVRGTRGDLIEGCLFRDLGGNGIQMGMFQDGGVETHVPYDPWDQQEVCTEERIANNVVTDCANEDWGCVGIAVGYARRIAIEHNEVSNLPYTGISLGWGWTPTKNCLRNNRVHANHIHHIATRLCDTAGIYTLSAQPDTVISENSVHSITMSPYVDRPEHWFYLYTDEGSSFITVRDNWCPEERFLKNANGPGNVWERNGPAVPPSIKEAAGLEPAFRDLLTGDKTPTP
jgi:hypothetical protein